MTPVIGALAIVVLAAIDAGGSGAAHLSRSGEAHKRRTRLIKAGQG
jgi:hypothetical protein